MKLDPIDISTARDVLALCTSPGRSRDSCARLVFVGWDDGTLVWSRDRLAGGPPYLTTNIGAQRVCDVLDRLDNDGLFSTLPLVGGCVPSSECTHFFARKDGKKLDFDTCHEQFEESGHCVAEYQAITPTGDRQRFAVLASQPSEYIFSRMMWLELRRIIETLIPETGQHCDGELEMLHGEFRWLPSRQNDAEP